MTILTSSPDAITGTTLYSIKLSKTKLLILTFFKYSHEITSAVERTSHA